MLRLMKLELKKFKFGWYVRGAVIANIIILALLIFVSFIAQIEERFRNKRSADDFANG